jgi:iron complex outermembrane receptor protein
MYPRRTFKSYRAYLALVTLALLGWSKYSLAQQPSSPGADDQLDLKKLMLEEIVVTAEKRSGTVQDTPISITAISGGDIAERGLTQFNDIAQAVPGVSMNTSGPGQTEFEMRGLTSSGGNSPTVGFYLDDIPLTAPSNASNGKVVIDPSVYDLSRVEVLRGPQGTLYGSSSMGGTIKLVTEQPNTAAFSTSAQTIFSATDGGGFNHGENLMVNVPLLDHTVAFRVVGTNEDTSGWINRTVISPGDFPLPINPTPTSPAGTERGDVLSAPVLKNYADTNDENLQSVRAQAVWEANSRLSVEGSFSWQRITQEAPSLFDSDPGTLTHYEPFDLQEPFSDRFSMWAAHIQYRFDSFDLTSITGEWSRFQNQTQEWSEILQWFFDFPSFYPPNGAGPAQITEGVWSRQLSEEMRLTSSGDSSFKWLAGAFFSDYSSTTTPISNVSGLAPFGLITNVTTNFQPSTIKQSAVFGETSYRLLPELTLTAGARWYSYRSVFTNAASGLASPSGTDAVTFESGAESDDGVTPKFDISYKPSAELTTYATISKGFRPGGGNSPIPTGAAGTGPECRASLAALGLSAAPLSYHPDSLWSYEIGEKAQLLDNRLTINSDVYFENWSKVQQFVQLPCGYYFDDNAGKAQVYGSELEIKALIVTGLTASASVGFTHARITEGSEETGTVAGDWLQDVPPWTSSVTLSYKRPVFDGFEFTALVENDYIDSRRAAAYYSLTPLPSYDLTNARLGLSRGPWAAHLFADNLLNKQAWLGYNNNVATNVPLYNRVASNQPLTIGIDLTYQLGARRD